MTNVTPQTDVQSDINSRVYRAPGIDRQYSSRQLSLVEAIALLKYREFFDGRDVLDIGVGTGRTSAYLHRLARRYIGIDYSPVMVRALQERMPDIEVQLADMRDLSSFDDGEFDFIFAANNVIDAVCHEDRLQTLREFSRVLRQGGAMILSAHNRHYERALAGPTLRLSRNPWRELEYLREWLRQLHNHMRVSKFRQQNPKFALLNDTGHDFSVLHYYIDREQQVAQLQEHGFVVLEVLDESGRSICAPQTAPDSPSLTYIARKVPIWV